MLRKVSVQQAMSSFKSYAAVVVVKRATGKVYIKESVGKGYAKTDEDGMLVFSSEAEKTRSGYLAQNQYQTAEKRMKLKFTTYEVGQFDFYLSETNNLFTIVKELNVLYNVVNEATKPTKVAYEPAPTPQKVEVSFDVRVRPATTSTNAFRRMLSL